MTGLNPIDLRIYRFHPLGLDPITVYVEQFDTCASRMTVQCHAQAWTAYWGAHSYDGLEAFVAVCGVDYVVDNLIWGQLGLFRVERERHQREYISRIVKAIQKEFLAIKGGG